MIAAVDYHSDLYVAVATIIPVIWLTTGFALPRIYDNFGYVREWKKTRDQAAKQPQNRPTDQLRGYRLLCWALFPPLDVPKHSITLRRSAVTIFFVVGLCGEIASILALAYEYPGREVRILTLVSALTVVVLGSLILGASLWFEIQRLIIDYDSQPLNETD